MRSRFSSTSGATLEGSAADFRGLADTLEEVAHSGEPASLPLDGAAPSAPYDMSLLQLCLRKAEDPVAVIVQHGSALTISGNLGLLSLAATCRFAAEQPGEHSHVEWHREHPWLDPRSEPLVLECLAP